MSFVYVLIFMMEISAALELKTYSTFKACKTAAEMAHTEQSSKWSTLVVSRVRYSVVARGKYQCLAKPA